jgi:hypothetical protein
MGEGFERFGPRMHEFAKRYRGKVAARPAALRMSILADDELEVPLVDGDGDEVVEALPADCTD